ncbi:hypothetical protein BKI52_19115 [marine bacterium AO1-C]|nr:hypothetical protein BKI52_19115 [marine bacterium AO1-C]
MIQTCHGYKKIEEVKAGDLVWSYNTQTSKKELRKVLKTFVRTAHQLIYLHLGNQIIKTTAEHPFYLEGKWVKAGDLNRGDSLYLFHSRKIALDSLTRVDTTIQVYNFSVAENHNYYAGKAGVLVHNADLYGLLDKIEKLNLQALKKGLDDLGDLKTQFWDDFASVKDVDGLLKQFDKNPKLVEGWAVLHKSGTDKATRISKFEDVKKYLDANPSKSIDDVAKEIKDAGGYQKWLPNKLLISLRKELRQLLGDQVSANQILSLYRNTPDLLPLLKNTIDELKFHRGLSFENKLKLLKNKKYVEANPFRETGIRIKPNWVNKIDDYWKITPRKRFKDEIRDYASTNGVSIEQAIIDFKIKKMRAAIQKTNAKSGKNITEVGVVLGRADDTKPFIDEINKKLSNNVIIINDPKWSKWGVIQPGVLALGTSMANLWLNVVQAAQTAFKLNSWKVGVKSKICFNLSSYDTPQAMTAMYSNPNRYFKNMNPSPSPKYIEGNNYTDTRITDMEMANIVRNKNWFDLTEFFVVRNGQMIRLTKKEVLEKYGIRYIGDRMNKKIK